MSNTIAHLTVANKILKACPNLVNDTKAFYLGIVAPDTIGSKENCAREDKKLVHLREGIRDAEWLNEDKMSIFQNRIHDFVEEHIHGAKESQRDFNMGYLVHLLTDEWNHKTIRQTMLKIANAQNVLESDREFFFMMVNDLEALDHFLLESDDEIAEILSQILDEEVKYSLPGFIEKEYIEGSIWWWKNTYLDGIRQRQLKYITEEDITEFVDVATRGILEELEQLL